jgi:hypothetical protein
VGLSDPLLRERVLFLHRLHAHTPLSLSALVGLIIEIVFSNEMGLTDVSPRFDSVHSKLKGVGGSFDDIELYIISIQSLTAEVCSVCTITSLCTVRTPSNEMTPFLSRTLPVAQFESQPLIYTNRRLHINRPSSRHIRQNNHCVSVYTSASSMTK